MIYLKSVTYGLLLSSSIDCGVDASLRGAKDRNERDLQSSSDNSRNIYCGAWNHKNCIDPDTGAKTNVLTVGMSETRPVRCCIDTLLSDAWKGCKTIANVYSDSFVEMDFTSAKNFCESNYEAHGGRLCNPGEMQDRCGTGSGLGYNKEHVWACIADGGTCEQNNAAACCTGYCNESNVCEATSTTREPTNNPTNEPSAKPVFPPTDKPSLGPSSSPTSHPSLPPSAKPVTGSPTGQPTAKPVTGSPSSSPTSSPSTAPSLKPVSQSPTAWPTSGPSGKPTANPSRGLTKSPTVTSLDSRNIYCGAWNHKNCIDPDTGAKTNVLTVGMSETRPVRCCIDTLLSDAWKGCKTIANVYSDSFVEMDFTSAKNFCESNYEAHGGRLCNPGEMQDRCGTGSGLGYNKEHVWACIADGGTCEQNNAAACCTGYCNESNVCEATSTTREPTNNPTNEPSAKPVFPPTDKPSLGPSSSPTSHPSLPPSAKPVTGSPTGQPTAKPVTVSPTAQPSPSPSAKPVTGSPTGEPTAKPVTGSPSSSPTSSPSTAPSLKPVSQSPTAGPTSGPSGKPTANPSPFPSSSPTVTPLECPDTLPGFLELCETDPDPVIACELNAVMYYALVPESFPGAENGILCARIEMPDHDGWMGIGFSEDGTMIGSPKMHTTAVVGVPLEGRVLKYKLNAKDKNIVAEMSSDQQTLRDTSIALSPDGAAIMTFTKLLKENDEVEILESGINRFISAKGGDYFLGDNHVPHYSGSANRQRNIIKDFSLDVPSLSPTRNPSSSPTKKQLTLSPSGSPTTTPTSNPIRAVVPQSCPYTYSGSINYAFGDSNDDGEGVLRYDLVRESSPGAGDGVLCGQLEVADTFDGWVAFGFSSTGQMIGSADPANVAVIGRVDDKSVKKYTLPGRYVVEMAQEDQTLLDTNIAVVNDNIIMTFTKLLNEDGEVEIVVDGANEFIAAKGQIISGNIANHGPGGRKDFILKDFSEDVPTSSPTRSPTGTDPTTSPSVKPTNAPSSRPTEFPTTSSALACPPTGTSIELNFGPQSFERAPAHTFCGIFIEKTSGALIPYARSYNEEDWEASPGPFASSSDGVFCTDKCQVQLPILESGGDRYIISSKGNLGEALTTQEQVANFLERTTFGATKAEIKALSADGDWTVEDQSAWVRNQINLPMSSHREYYRERANAVWDTPAMPAKSDHPCSPNSLWRKYAFIEQDRYDAYSGEYNYQTFEIVPEEANSVVHIIEAEDASNYQAGSYGGIEACRDPSTRYCSGGQQFDFNGQESFIEWEVTVSAEMAGVVPISFRYMNGDDFNDGNRPVRLMVNNVTVVESHDFFHTEWNYYRYSEMVDINLQEGQNTIKLVDDTGIGPYIDHMRLGKPAAVVMKTQGIPRAIAPNGLRLADDWDFEFTDSTVLGFDYYPDAPQGDIFRFGWPSYGRIRYVLPDGRTRFLDIGNPSLSNFEGYTQYLPDNIIQFEDANLFENTTSDIEGVPLVEGQTMLLPNGLDSSSHPVCDLLPNYSTENNEPVIGRLPDGTYVQWTPTILFENNGPSMNTPASELASSTLSDGGGATSSSTANALSSREDAYGTFCSNVPRSQFNEKTCILSTDPSACYDQEIPGYEGGVVVCGSPGEVANDPSKRHQFDVRSDESITALNGDIANNQKNLIWSEIALNSDDQLRQRMAWALCQIVTVVPSNIDRYDFTEVFTHYYDNCIKHAFGNYLDLLRETSYSPLMAEHLSFLDGKSHQYVYQEEDGRISRADENFAREIMQLFSIGLLVLNDDGTPVLNPESGMPLETYTNEHIEQFARAWTGFRRVQSRGNHEDNDRWDRNRLDPMRIDAAWRDPWPVADLNGGFVGDRFPLCSDLPDQSFLKAGAKYILNGGNPLPTLMTDRSEFADEERFPQLLRLEPNPSSSQLFKALAPDVNGQFAMTVVLEDDIDCDGTECELDTVRTVKIGSVYYEFVEKPCVQLAFYEGGKQVNFRENADFGSMCANPSLPHASEACCRAERVYELNAIREPGVTFFYEGERVKYDTAKQRCTDYGLDLCFWEHARPYNGTQIMWDDWWRQGYGWTNKDCEVWVKINGEGKVAVVHNAETSRSNLNDDKGVASHVLEDTTLNWFKVHWEDDYPGSSENNSCSANNCKSSSDGYCVCKTTVTESAVFDDLSMSRDDILSQLYIGATSIPVGSIPTCIPDCDGWDYIAHSMIDNTVDANTVFEVEDFAGRKFLLKNTLSTVGLNGWQMPPETYEAESATNSLNMTLKADSSASGGAYYDPDQTDAAFIEWDNISVPADGEFEISFRYALDTYPKSMDIFINGVELELTPERPTPPVIPDIKIEAKAELVFLGSNRRNWEDLHPNGLGMCQGDCDNDDECEGQLRCYQRNSYDAVPGCSGEGTSGIDYCALQEDSMIWYVGNPWDSSNSLSQGIPLGRCEGDCNTDADCEGSLQCYQRDNLARTPGCTGFGPSGKDFCAEKGEGELWIMEDNSLLGECEGYCWEDSMCEAGLFCYHASGTTSYFPGCEGGSVSNNRDYCVDPKKSKKLLFLPTGGWTSDWHYTEPIKVFLTEGLNTIRMEVPSGAVNAPNLDLLRIEQHLAMSTSTATFRNPPHFVSLQLNEENFGEQNERDAQYQTEAVLEHYFHQPNVAPFLCVRLMQRFGFSNPGKRYVKNCVDAFRSGTYTSGGEAFGKPGDYGNLEATAAAILLDREASDATLLHDPSYGSLREPLLKVMALMKSMEYQTQFPDNLPGPEFAKEFQTRLYRLHTKIGQGAYEFPSVFSWFLPEYVANAGPSLEAQLVSPESMILTLPNTVGLLNGMFSLIKYGLSSCYGGFGTDPDVGRTCFDLGNERFGNYGRYARSFGRLTYEPEGSTPEDWVDDLSLLLTSGRLSESSRSEIVSSCEYTVSLEIVGDGIFTEGLYPLGICQGDCDLDSDCGDGLLCFNRNGFDQVPGCEGRGSSGWDYCYAPECCGDGPEVEDAGNNGNPYSGYPADVFPLGLCQGDCDNDSECGEGLVCFNRNGFTDVPGCTGSGTSNTDYCIDPTCPSGNAECSLGFISPETIKGETTRCMQQLIVTTAEFQTSNLVESSGEDRSYPPPIANEEEPYKALVYMFFDGGMDSFNMLSPYTCSNAPDGTDTYEQFRDIRGRRTSLSEQIEGVGLPRSRLQPIQANNPDQPCEVFGVHENLPILKALYDEKDLGFVANAGLLAKPTTRSTYNADTPTQLFAHNAMQEDSKREDLFDHYGGSGVIGRMADVLTTNGIPTNMFSIDGSQVVLIGEAGAGGPSPFTISSEGLAAFNQNPDFDTEAIKILNRKGKADSGFFSETWSLKLSESLANQDILKEALDNTQVQSPDITADDLNSNSFLRELIMCTRIMQTRDIRGSKRDACFVQEGGWDHHSEVDVNISERFSGVNFAIEKFVKEVKALNLWQQVTVVQFSEFARTLDPNSGNGVDHAWGGNHFYFGGAVNGGKVRGLYPHDFVESASNPVALSRGRLIPQYPWDSMLYGTAEWFGINVEGDEIDKVLPMNKNFPPEKLYREAELYKAVLPTTSAQILVEGSMVVEMADGEPATEMGNDIIELDLTIDNEGELATGLLGLSNLSKTSPLKTVGDKANEVSPGLFHK